MFQMTSVNYLHLHEIFFFICIYSFPDEVTEPQVGGTEENTPSK